MNAKVDSEECNEVASRISSNLGYMMTADFTESELNRIKSALDKVDTIIKKVWEREGL